MVSRFVGDNVIGVRIVERLKYILPARITNANLYQSHTVPSGCWEKNPLL